MASFVPGGGTLKSTTLEGAFLEAIMLLLSLEKNPTLNPSNESRVTFQGDQSLILTGVCTFSGTEILSSTNDSLTWSVNNYIGSGFVFSSGTTGTLKAPNLPAAIVSLAKRIQILESQTAKNPQGLNRVNLESVSDTSSIIVKWSIQTELTFSSTGLTQLTAKPYLVD